MLMISDLRVGYQNMPKVATTSMFKWFHESIQLARTGKPPERRFQRRDFFVDSPGRPALATSVDNTAPAMEPYPDYYRFALTRDPVRRFISMYSNRVVFLRELTPEKVMDDLLEKTGLAPDPEINLLVDRLEAYCGIQHSLIHHAGPMIERLGPDLGVYRRIADISQVNLCIDEIRQHLRAQGREALVALLPPLGRSNTGGPKLGLEVLNPYSFEKLLDFYREDYEQIPTVDVEETKAAWRAARGQAFTALERSVADALEARAARGRKRPGVKKNRKRRKPAGAATAPGAARGRAAKAAAGAGTANAATRARPAAREAPGKRADDAKPAGRGKRAEGGKRAKGGKGAGAERGAGAAGKGGTFRPEYPPCALVQKVRLNPPAARGVCAGIVLLAPQAAADYELQLVGPEGTRALEWGLDSPRLLARFADNPHARRARFRGEASAVGGYEIRLVQRAGREAWPVVRFGVAERAARAGGGKA